jgi:hypothetical protein
MSELTIDLRYPIGKFRAPESYTKELLTEHINIISTLPARLKKEVEFLTDQQLDTPYRPEGWTVRQVIHHLPDSHLNAYTRMKLAMTEENPTIKPYNEVKWAELQDAKTAPVKVSLELLTALHARWTMFLKNLSDTDFERSFNHPDNGPTLLKKALALYAWHSNHHLGHITSLKSRMGW